MSSSGPGVVRSEAPVGEAYLWDGDGRVAWDEAVSWHHEPGTFRPVARERGGAVHHVVTDHLGTPRELYDADGRRAWARSHRLWGGTRGVWRGEAANDGAVSLAGGRAARKLMGMGQICVRSASQGSGRTTRMA